MRASTVRRGEEVIRQCSHFRLRQPFGKNQFTFSGSSRRRQLFIIPLKITSILLVEPCTERLGFLCFRRFRASYSLSSSSLFYDMEGFSFFLSVVFLLKIGRSGSGFLLMLKLGIISSNFNKSISSYQESAALSLQGSKSNGLLSIMLVLIRDQKRLEALWLWMQIVDILGSSDRDYSLSAFIEKVSSWSILIKIYYVQANNIFSIILNIFKIITDLEQQVGCKQTELKIMRAYLYFQEFFTFELYRRNMEERAENLDSTAGFINHKCKKDHLKNSPLLPPKKAESLYHNDYHSRLKLTPFADYSNLIGKERNSPVRHNSKHVDSFGTSYRASFEGHDSPKPVRMKEKASFFLKHDNYEPPTSTYNRMSIINKRGSEFSMYERAKPRGDNLSIPKYNRMNSSSIYQVEFDAPMKLPQIAANKKIEIRRSSTQKYKISKIF